MLEGVADKERRLSGRNGTEYGTTAGERGQGGRGETMGKGCREREKGEFTIHDRRAILTVGNTLILDLQVFVGPWAGVGEDI